MSDRFLTRPQARKWNQGVTMPTKLFAVKIAGELRDWLSSQENMSDTIKRALIEFRKENTLSDEVSGQLLQLLEAIRGVDSKLDKILEKDENKQ